MFSAGEGARVSKASRQLVFALEKIYALLVLDGPLKYTHHDAAIDLEKLILLFLAARVED